ncbi:hypothetical protein [Methylobacterium sp. CM6247]
MRSASNCRAGYKSPPVPLLQAMRVMVNLLAQYQFEPVNLQTHATVFSLVNPYRIWA